MYTATITNKETIDNVFSITVEFSNGTKSFLEKVKPQDEAGFKYWVKQRLASLNSSEVLESADNIGVPIDVSDPVPVDTRTQAEIDRDEWLKKYNKWVRVKTNLIDTGVLVGDELQVVALLNEVKTDFKPNYLNFI